MKRKFNIPLHVILCVLLLVAAFHWSQWLWLRAFMVVVLFLAVHVALAAIRAVRNTASKP